MRILTDIINVIILRNFGLGVVLRVQSDIDDLQVETRISNV